MDKALLNIKNLTVEYRVDKDTIRAVDNLNISISRGESLGIIGESGSEKTSLAMAIMGLIKKPTRVDGQIFLDGESINGTTKSKLNLLRWTKMAIVFQNSLEILNPLLTIHEQIYEVLKQHTSLQKKEIESRIDNLLIKVKLAIEIKYCYPHQLSGGMRQKVLIAMALSCEPDLLIVDEPTSSLDMVSKNEIIELISSLYEENNFALLVISHELDTVLKLTSKICVMYAGSIVERGDTVDVISDPMHSYTKGLLNSSPAINPFGDMWGIPKEIRESNGLGCSFENRCTQSIELCKTIKPTLESITKNREVSCNRGGIVTILKGENISKKFSCKNRMVEACNSCNIKIRSGEVVALIGESGSGKTTLASMLTGLIKPDKGQILFEDSLVNGSNFTNRENGMQIVLQDPFASINENLSIREAVSEPLKIIKKLSLKDLEDRVKEVLKEVQLPDSDLFIQRKCFTLSGGQRQRVSLARSLIVKPKILIADEISSMLDPSTQANILRLLKKLQNELGFSMLYITHDLAVARKIADRVYVMSDGHILEEGSSAKIFSNPQNHYTKKLISETFNFI